MAVVTTKSGSITNLDASPVLRPGSWMHGGAIKLFSGTVEAVDGDSIGSIYRMFRVGSWMRPEAVILANDALSAGTGDVGLYRTTVEGGAVVDADFFASAVSMAAAGKSTNGTNVTVESDSTAMNIDKAEKRIWEVLGLTVDPNLEYDVAITLTAAAGAAGTVTLRGTFTW
jgi:hypothetical protein